MAGTKAAHVSNGFARLLWRVLSFVLFPIWWPLDKCLSLRSRAKLRRKVRTELSFLFDLHDGRFVPNQGLPRGADAPCVTVGVNGLLIQFLRARGDLFVRVASSADPSRWYDLILLVSVVEKSEELEYRSAMDMIEASRVLEPRIDRLKQAFSKGSGRDLAQEYAVAHRALMAKRV